MRLRCTDRIAETHDVVTFVFRVLDGPLAFRAGQALTLALPVDGGVVRRTFSIASSASRPNDIRVTVKTRPGSVAAAWMHRALVPGVDIEARGPHGRFVLPAPSPSRLALVSAGSGATPLMAMLRTLADANEGGGVRPDVAWLHAARTVDDVLFGRELVDRQADWPELAVSVVVTRPGPGWFGYRGRIGRRLLSVAVPDLASREVFCCGPEAFMDAVRAAFLAEGGLPDRFQVERFGTTVTAPMASSPEADAFGADLDGRRFGVASGETILAAAQRSGVAIACGCTAGVCGTCRLQLRSGKVEMRHQGGLSEREEAEGWVLACSSRLLTNITLSR